MTNRLLGILLLLSSSAALAQGVSEETPLRPVTQTLAITNARVIVSPGEILERATVVIRDGRIEEVGPRVSAPPDARVIEGDSLWVYPGFIDAYSFAAVPEPKKPEETQEEENDFRDRGNPTREEAGILPDRDVRTLLDPTRSAVDSFRSAGFTLAHAVPRGGLFPGTTALVLLRETDRLEFPDHLVLGGPVALTAQMDGNDGGYPGTPMGILSVMRERFENARRAIRAGDAWRGNGATYRPGFDPSLEALQPVLWDEMPFLFRANNALNAFRGLRLAKDAELSNVILAGVLDATPLVDRLREEDIPVIAPLALPDTVEADSALLAIPLPDDITPDGRSFVTYRRTQSYRNVEAEKRDLITQQRLAVRRHEANPALLAAASIPFAFGSFDVKAEDIRPNLLRMVEAGLSPDDALTGLITAPAQMLDIDDIAGSIERGRLGNLVLTTGDYFSEETDVRMVIVEGAIHEMEKVEKEEEEDENDE